MLQGKAKVYALHAIGCLLFLGIPLFLFPRPPEEVFFFRSRPVQRDLIANFLMLLFFYLNFYVLIPTIYFRKNYVLYGIVILAALLMVCTIPSLITGHNVFTQESIGPPGMKTPAGDNWTPPKPPGSYFIEEIRHHIFLFLVVVLFSVLLSVRNRLFEIREEKLNAELSSLKAQINPHFLFNTLNSIYALTVKKDDKASDAVINLAGLMRYIIKDANNNKIPLQQELDYITNYVELQRSRLRDTAKIQFTCTGDVEEKEIAPLILITYIENAFKYGVNPDEDAEIAIHITVDESKLHLKAFNNKVRKSANIISTGIGIENTKERLKLLYPEKHILEIEENDKSYTVNLTIHLQ